MTRSISLCLLLLSQISLAATVDPVMDLYVDSGLDRLMDESQKPNQLDGFIFWQKPGRQSSIQLGKSCSNPVNQVDWQGQEIYEMQIAGSLFTNQGLDKISKLLTNIRLNASKPRQVIRRKPSFARCKGGCCYPCDVRSRCSTSGSCSRYSL